MFGKMIIALTNGRSGSSLICGIIAKHGAWTGPVKAGDHRNPDGFYENGAIYSLAGKHGGIKSCNRLGRPDARWEQEFISLIKEQGYKKGPLVIKHSPYNWPLWEAFDPIYCTIRRPMEAQLKSRKNVNQLSAMPYIDWGEECMDKREAAGAIRIDADKVIGGDCSQIKEVLEKANLEFNQKICDDFIKPDYWHF